MRPALIFDLDGTLTDPKQGITRSICYGLEKMGRVPPDPDTLTWCIGPPLQRSLAHLLDSEEDSAQCMLHYRERFGTIGMFENVVYEGIPETLDRLIARGHDLYVATSKPHFYAEPILRHFDLHGRFKAVFGSELDGTRVDKGELLRHVLKREEIASENAVMIGDRTHDLIGARKNGIPFVGVLYGYGSREELSEAHALVKQPSDLPDAILAMGIQEKGP